MRRSVNKLPQAVTEIPLARLTHDESTSFALNHSCKEAAMKWRDIKKPLAISRLTADADDPLSLIVSTIKSIPISYDEAKSARNARERNLPFSMVESFNFGTACYELDNRNDYREARSLALGFLGHRLHVLCFTPVGEGIRVISFRKANPREIRSYEKNGPTDQR